MNGKIFGKKVVRFGFVAFALALGLAACGDDGSTNRPSNNHEDTNISSVESEENLPSCTESRDGFVNFINGTKEGFVCKNRRWDHYDMIADVEENLPGCTGSREGLSAYLYEEDRELNCVEGSWDVVGEVASSSSSEKSGSSSSREKDGSSSSVAPNSSSSVILSSSSEGTSIKDGSKYDASANTLTDLRDGQVYKTVTIGIQTWMAENLNYDPGNVSSMGSYAWSGCYNNESSNCAKYGRLYTWEVAMNNASCAYGKTCDASLNPTNPVRGVCPQGWHLPSHREFEELINYIDPSFRYDHITNASSSTAGQYLKSLSGWNSSGNGSDAYGFSALPGGSRGNGDYFVTAGDGAYFWSSGEHDSSNAFELSLDYYNEDAFLDYFSKYLARSVRCLKD